MTTTSESPANSQVSKAPEWVTPERVASLVHWVSAPVSGGKETRTATAPYDNLPTVAVPACTSADVEASVAQAREAQVAWARLSHRDRAEVVLRFHDLMMERQDEVLDLIQWEMGKARFHAWQEVLQVANIARHYANHGKTYLKDNKVRGAVPVVTSVREVRVPRGVVGIISPWNYPFYLGTGDAIPALLAGNSVVGKADPQTPLTLLWARALMAEAGLPEHVWQIVAGDGPAVGQAVIDQVDYVCFTGSTATGRIVARQAAERLIGVSLELGGKNPLIVRADADLDQAARGTADAAFANTGQMCIHIERVIVHESVYDDFADRLVKTAEGLNVGQTYDYSSDVGSLASQAQLDKVSAHVQDAVAKGATVLAGGRARPDLGPFVYEPTVLADVTDDMDLCLGETFGPVVALYKVADDEAAIEMANRGRQGLSSSIFSKDTATANAMAPRIRAGSVNINDGAALAAGSIEAGMGGMGESGIGKRHGGEGIRKFTQSQTVGTSKMGPVGPPPSMTVAKFVGVTNGQLKVLRKLGMR